MFFANFYPIFNRWRWQVFAGFYKMFYLIKYPRVANCSAADHDAIYTKFIFIFYCFFRAINIAVTKNRYRNSWVVFYFADQFPICMALVHLCTRAAVNG